NTPWTRTGENGGFTITRRHGPANRLAVIAKDPVFWVVFRASLRKADEVEIKLPAAGRLVVSCDFPPQSEVEGEIQLTKIAETDRQKAESVRFKESRFSLKTPSEIGYQQLPPGFYDVQCIKQIKMGRDAVLNTCVGQQFVKIESGKRANIRFEHKVGQPLSGVVRGLEDIELNYAHVLISRRDPEELPEDERNFARPFVFFDVVPINPDGRFTTDPIPPGRYSAELRASTWKLPQWSGAVSFTVPNSGNPPIIEITAAEN
ncbi:MAG: hypothetical protein KDB23_21580, partial [Planctomycetales bacterium]|nr:hypothetical protein [Planctomycetales bacterium]